MSFSWQHLTEYLKLTAIIIQISYTVRILIFWLVDLCHVTLSYDETTASFTNNELKIVNTALGGLVRYWNFSFIVSELVQVNPDNSRATSVLTCNYN